MDQRLSDVFRDNHQEILRTCVAECHDRDAASESLLEGTLDLGIRACSEAVVEEDVDRLKPLIDLLLKHVVRQERNFPQFLRLLESLRRTMTNVILKETEDQSRIKAVGLLNRCVDHALENIANHFNEDYDRAQKEIQASNRRVDELERGRVKFASKRSRGWVDVGGTRMCLLDISGGWVNIGLSMMLFAGGNTSRRVLFEGGQSETFSRAALNKGILKNTAEGFRDAVDTYSEAGFGDFVIRELGIDRGYARITCRNAFEGWALMQNQRYSQSTVCYYSAGVLLSFMKNISGREDLISVETKCIAKGDDECEFLVGNKAELRKMGIEPPEWGMTIKERAEYLENLLDEKNKIQREITKKNVELAALNRISATVNQSLDLDEILNFAIHELSNVVGDKGIGFYLLDRKKNELVFTAQKGFSEEFYRNVGRLKIGEGMAGNVAQQGAPMAYEDYSRYPHALESALKKEKIRSVLSVPLTTKDKIVGILNVATRTPYHFNSEEINLMNLIGNQIGVAVENAQLLEQIKESERMYKTLVEDINDGYIMCQNGQVIFTNNAFLTMHGYNRDEVLGRDFRAFLAKEYMPHVEKIFRDGVKMEEIPEHIEFHRRHRNGDMLPTELKINLVEFKGMPTLIGIFRDISVRKEMERKVIDNQWLASIGQLSANIAHEIRNPLSGIKTNIQMLSKNLNLQGFNKRRLEIAEEEIKRLSRILDDILDFSTPLKMDTVSHDISEIIEKCIDLLGEKFREKNVGIVRKTAKNNPPIPMNCEKMEQAILNVMLNAVDAMPGGGTLEIGTDGTEHLGRKMLRVEIRDSGHGISLEHIDKIFDPFFSTKTKGAGLGLSNVKKVVEAHHGIIEVKRQADQGTKIILLLPVE